MEHVRRRAHVSPRLESKRLDPADVDEELIERMLAAVHGTGKGAEVHPLLVIAEARDPGPTESATCSIC